MRFFIFLFLVDLFSWSPLGIPCPAGTRRYKIDFISVSLSLAGISLLPPASFRPTQDPYLVTFFPVLVRSMQPLTRIDS